MRTQEHTGQPVIYKRGMLINVKTSTPAEHKSLRRLVTVGSKPAAEVMADFSFKVLNPARFGQVLAMHEVERVWITGGAK